MAKPLKDSFDKRVIQQIAKDLHAAYPALDPRAFVRASAHKMGPLSLTKRGHRVAEVMRAQLPQDFETTARILETSLGPAQISAEGMGMTVFRYMPHVFFVGRYGVPHFEASMRLQHALTQRFTAEFSIRSFLIEHPEATLARLVRWTEDDSLHVRRLVSEGVRPRLPWAPRLPAFIQDPAPVIALLERLRDDPEPYVQRSVGNCLNDISKDHPDRVAALARAWLERAPEGRRWVVERGLRSLVKQGHRGALSALGFAKAPKVQLKLQALSPKKVALGQTLRFGFCLKSQSARAQSLLVDYAVHFMKANGQQRPKVFKLKRLSLPAGGSAELEAQVSFKALSTRAHYPGAHRIEVLINGIAHPLARFEVCSK